MEGFAGMEEVGGGPGGAERGGDFAGDEAGFADAEEDDAVLVGCCFKNKLDGEGEGRLHGAIEADGEREQGAGFDADEFGGARGVGHGYLEMLAEGRGVTRRQNLSKNGMGSPI